MSVKTIDLTPSWTGLVPALISMIEHGTPEARKVAIEEITRMARALDAFNAEARK